MKNLKEKISESSIWRCPKCKREFKKKNQSHYCIDKPQTITDYILLQDENKQKELFHLKDILLSALPDIEQRISWGMPTFWKNNNIVHFAALKNQIGFYPGQEAIEHFQNQLSNYKTAKGSIKIPYGKLDDDLIIRIAKWCYETNSHG